MSDTLLRACRLDDHAAMLALWDLCGLHPSSTDTPEALAHKLERDPQLFLIAESAGRLIGTVLGSYDGRRGWINRLAVHPDWRGQGVADQLMAEVERHLMAIGCRKVNLLIEQDNAGVQAYYARLGFNVDPLIFMEKWLG